MSAITQIRLRLVTGNRADASSSGDVFLGLGGREFNVDSHAEGYNDFERGDDRTYVFGEDSTVLRPEQNDPRTPWQIDHIDIGKCPRYLRFEPGPGGDWNLERVEVWASWEGGSFHTDRLRGAAHLWLGESRGKALYFS